MVSSLEIFVSAILVFAVTIAIVIYAFFKWTFQYWSKRGLPHLEPVFPYGTMERSFNRKIFFSLWIKNNYDEFKSKGYKHGGIYNFASPVYIPVDPEYVKNILQRDFNHFIDRGIYYNEKDDPLSAHLVSLGGQRWRHLRAKLTPTFTSGKMKTMFDILVQCGEPMKKVMEEYAENQVPVDVKEVVARFTTDIFGSCAFGLNCNSFERPDAEFRHHGKQIFTRSQFRAFALLFFLSVPKLGHFLKVRVFSKATTDFFTKIVKETISYRETNNVMRNDLLQLLMNLQENGKSDQSDEEDKGFTLDEIAAEAMLFFGAGSDTSSTTMTSLLLEVSLQPDIQDRLRVEINKVLANHDNKFTYDSMCDMKYLGQVVDETLRKYPPFSHITRRCIKEYPVPDSDVVIEKNTTVMISTLGLHRDPEHYPDPEKFDPERFSDENKQSRHPFTYLPFGEGPRLCIGMRFGLMETKVGLVTLLKNFKFTLNEKTKIPIQPDPLGVVWGAKNTIWLNAERIQH